MSYGWPAGLASIPWPRFTDAHGRQQLQFGAPDFHYLTGARPITQQEARRMADDIADLEQQLDDKFQEILDAVAAQLKLGKYDDLSDADQERVENEAEVAADQWMDDNEAGPKEPKSPFEKLLADYAALALKFPDEELDDDEEEEADDHKPHK